MPIGSISIATKTTNMPINSGHRLYLLIIDCTSANHYSYVHAVWQELGWYLLGHVCAHPYMSLVSAWLSAVLMHATIACRPMRVT